MAYTYQKFANILSKPAEERLTEEIQQLEPWMRKRCSLLNSLDPDTLHDVIKHCEFKSVGKHDVIILQGEKGDAFYVILRGSVSVMLKDSPDFTDDPRTSHKIYRDELGSRITTLREGDTFGELALVEDDNIRTASVVADEVTDFAVVHLSLYKRSVGQVLQQEYREKKSFVDDLALCRPWADKWKKHLAASLSKRCLDYTDVLIKQGDPADHLLFIASGEVKLHTEPGLHEEQFGHFMKDCQSLITDEERAKTMAPNVMGLTRWLSLKTSRILKSAPTSSADEHIQEGETAKVLCGKLSPSSARRRAVSAKALHSKHNLCYLETGQMVGDVEFLTGLKRHHATAACTQRTTVMVLHKAFYDRWFRRKNPSTVTQMKLHLELQIIERVSKGLGEKVPLLKCIKMKIEELNGHRKPAAKLRMRRAVKRSKFTDPTRFYSNPKSHSIFHSGTASLDGFDFKLEWNLLSPRGQYKALHSHASHSAMPLPRPALMDTELPVEPTTSQPDGRSESRVKEGTETVPPSTDQNQPPAENGEAQHKDNKNQRAIVLYHMGKTKTMAYTEREAVVPRDGIFVKLMHVSHPELERSHLNLTDEEYNYLTGLRRRLGRQIYDLHPQAQVQKLYRNTAPLSQRKGRSATDSQIGLPKLKKSESSTASSTTKKTDKT